VTGGETRAFPQVSREELERMAREKAFGSEPPEPEAPTESPFGDMSSPPPAGGETRAFPRMSFDDLQKLAGGDAAPAAPAPSEPEPEPPSPWEQPPVTGGETRAFPQMSFEQLQKMAEEKAMPEPPKATSPWEEQSPSFATEQPGPASIDFELQPPVAAPEPAQPPTEANLGGGRRYEDIPFTASEEAPLASAQSQPSPAAAMTGELTQEQIDRIARRVIELMSADVVRTIAWEVIPDMAEMVVKERIRELENE
jgi:hypothetical protein